MVHTFIQNLIAFGKSMPTNMLILVIICLIMKFGFGKKWKDCLKVIIVYLLLGLLLGIFGYNMPNFVEIGHWITNEIKSVW